MDFVHSTATLSGGLTCVALQGDLHFGCARAVKEYLTGILSEQKKDLVLDLEHVNYIDSTGIGVLMQIHIHAKGAGGHLYLVAAKPEIQRLLQITGLDAELLIYDSRQNLIDSLGPAK